MEVKVEKLLARLKKRIWKTNLDDFSRQEVYKEVEYSTEDACQALSCFIKRLKNFHEKRSNTKRLTCEISPEERV